MFTSSKSQPLSMSLPSHLGAPAPPPRRVRPLTPAEQYQQAVVTARVFLEGSRGRVARVMERYGAVANSTYWFYGYFGANMMATMALCLSLGRRMPLVRSYSGWIAMAGGYFGGKLCLGVHTSYLLSDVIKQLDREIKESKTMDERMEHLIPDYLEEANRLTKMKFELMPTLPEAIAAHADTHEQTLDERADALVNAFLKRKEALDKKS
ncbi:unnamed protein product [Phytomonas sp. Hart1]|nr:unnamed protein product [Phytomonas sp. Hart1]|eukprot:CCW71089.1 unnamed protein product [Phytomonas sp. isolate Hart1]